MTQSEIKLSSNKYDSWQRDEALSPASPYEKRSKIKKVG